jgi:hypothetical protein
VQGQVTYSFDEPLTLWKYMPPPHPLLTTLMVSYENEVPLKGTRAPVKLAVEPTNGKLRPVYGLLLLLGIAPRYCWTNLAPYNMHPRWIGTIGQQMDWMASSVLGQPDREAMQRAHFATWRSTVVLVKGLYAIALSILSYLCICILQRVVEDVQS